MPATRSPRRVCVPARHGCAESTLYSRGPGLSFALLVAIILIPGCASLGSKPEPPEVSIAGLGMVSADLFEQRFSLRLRFLNPNDFPIDIQGMNYKVLLNGKSFASGVSNREVHVPAFGEAVSEVEVVSNITRIVGQLKHLATASGGRGPESLDYRIEGGIKLSNWSAKIPFEYEGTVSLTAPREGLGPAASSGQDGG